MQRDLYKMLTGQTTVQSQLAQAHPLSQCQGIFVGYGRTKIAHTASGALAPSAHKGRLNSAYYVILGFRGALIVQLGLQLAIGASANGKCPYPTDCSTTLIAGLLIYAGRISQAAALLVHTHVEMQSRDTAEVLAWLMTTQIYSVADWIQKQSIHSSDLVAVNSMVYRYMNRNPFSTTPAGFHLCGPPDTTLTPRWPPDVFASAGLDGKHLQPPPQNIWHKGEKSHIPKMYMHTSLSPTGSVQ